MENEELVDLDTSTQDEEIISDEEISDDIEIEEQDLSAELAKANEIAENQRIRAEKAEAKLKKPEKKEETSKNDSLSQKDLIAIIKADIHEEDISDVADYAKFKNISVSEALKSSVVKTILENKKEERKTAQATSTGNARRGSSKQTSSQLVENASKGIMPDSDDDLNALVKARLGK